MSNIALAVPSRVRAEKYFANVDPKTKAFEASDSVVTMAVTPKDQVWLVLQNGGIEIRNVHSGHVVHSYAASTRPTRASRVWCALPVVVEGPNGTSSTQMWLGLASGSIEVHDADRFELLRQLRKHISGVYCLANNDSKSVFSGSSDFHIAQWRVKDGRLLRVLSGHSNYVRCLFSERSALVSGSDDGTIKVWSVDDGSLLYTAVFHRNSSRSLPQEEPRQRRLSRPDDTDPSHGTKNGVSALCRVGMTMWSGDNSGSLAIWKLQDGSPLLVSRPHSSRITSIQKVGSRVYTSSADGTICVHNALDGTLVQTLRDHVGSRVMDVKCAVEVDRYYVWTGAADNTIRCWHHDEHIPMTNERESFNDMRWYYATQRPYEGANKRLLEEQKELTELCMLTVGSTEAVQDFIDDTDERQQTGAMQYYVLEGKVKELQKATNEAEEKKNGIEKNITEKKQQLEEIRQNYQRVSEQLNQARTRQQNAYLYGGGGYNPYTGQSQPGVGTGVLPPTTDIFGNPTTTTVSTTTGLPLPTTSLEANNPWLNPNSNPPGSTTVVSSGNVLTASESHGTMTSPTNATTTGGPLPLPRPSYTTPPQVSHSASIEPDLSSLPPPPPPPSTSTKKVMPLSSVVFGVSQKATSKAVSSPPDKGLERRSSFTLGTGGGTTKPLGGRRLSF